MATPRQISLIKSLAIQRGLDPRAVLAVAQQEGLGGGIGDQGTSFGPFQLHRGGALPQEIPLESAHNWAWSAAGLKYALSRIASVARGLSGESAISNIVSRFERPANPQKEIAGAISAYRKGQIPSAGVPSYTPPIGSTAVSAPQSNNALLKAILSGATDLTGVIRQEYAGGAAPIVLQSRRKPSKRVPDLEKPSGSILAQIKPSELLKEGVGGPTHSTGPHIHVAYTNPQAMLAAIQLAQSLGLHVGENPYVGGVAPVHAKHSYHYRAFPGAYGGKRLGEAIDVSGKNMEKFYKLLLKA